MDPTTSTNRAAAHIRAERSASTRESITAAPAVPRATQSLRHNLDGAPLARRGGGLPPLAGGMPPRSALPAAEGDGVPLRDIHSHRSDDISFRSDSGYFSAFSEPEALQRGARIQREDRPPLGRDPAPEPVEAKPGAEVAEQAAAGADQAPAPAQQSLRQRAAAALRRRTSMALNRQAAEDVRRQAADAGLAALNGAAALGRTVVAPITLIRSHIASARGMDSGALLRLPMAALGHLVHQGVAVGFTTAVREVAAEAMIAGLRQAPPGALLGIELGMGVVNMSMQALRQVREKRNPDEAARGFHALSPQEWAGKTPQEQAVLRKEQQQHSDRVVALQATSLMVNVGFAVHGMLRGDSSFAAASIASEAKTLAYSLMRDSIQSKFGMIQLQGDSHGVSGSHLAGAALFYGGANLAIAYAWSALPPLVLPAGVTAGNVRDVLRGVSVPGLSLQDAVGATVKMIGVKATLNTALEAADWFSVTEQEARQAGTQQVLSPHIKADDFGRLKDHVAARVAIIDSSSSVGDLVGFLTKDMPPAVGALLTNGALGGWAAVNYRSIAGTWQADSAVRVVEDPRPAAPRDPEVG